MAGSRTALLAAAVAALSGAVACVQGEAKSQAGRVAVAVASNHGSDTAALKFVVASQGNEARYRVREQLLGLDFPNDAVGVTKGITGTLAFDAQGNVLAAESKIIVDVTKLTSDKERRDGYVQRRLLQTEQHPTVVLVPKAVRGVTLPLAKGGAQKVELMGDLTVRGVTRPTTWHGEAKFDGSSVTGQVTTTFTFADFEIEKPKVRSVLSVEDDIKLEYEFTLVPAN